MELKKIGKEIKMPSQSATSLINVQ